jgi:hypothetical protein
MCPLRRAVLPLRHLFLLLLACATAAWGRAPVPSEFGASRPLAAKRAEPRTPGCGAAAPLAGENFAAAIVIDHLPFAHAGSTCPYRDDYSPECTFLTGAPDVVFVYTPPTDECVDIDLCSSAYDTAVHVYDKSVANPVACNDDFCGLASQLTALRLARDRTYYVVVDGWYTGCGDYTLQMNVCQPPCQVDFVPGEIPEGEPLCADGSYDRFNTGCNDYPYVFSRLRCGPGEIAVRGTYGTWRYYDEEFRDTDWYRLDVADPTLLDTQVTGGAMTQVAILDGSRGCPEYDVVCGSAYGGPCQSIRCQALVPPGTYYLFVAPRNYQGVPCGTPYSLRLTGDACGTIDLAPTTWSQVKGRYR